MSAWKVEKDRMVRVGSTGGDEGSAVENGNGGVKTWQWAVSLFLTVIIAIAGSLWSVGLMRADDMQRVTKAETKVESLERDRQEMKASLIRIEAKLDAMRDRERYGKAWGN